MKGCHNCEHASAIAEGKYAGKPWEDVPCSGCEVMEDKSRSFEYEEWRRTAVAVDESEEQEKEEDRLPVSVLREALVGFLSLPPDLRDVVAWRYAGMKYGDIAKVQEVTEGCAERRHKRAMEIWPVLRALFPEKFAKHERRRMGVADSN